MCFSSTRHVAHCIALDRPRSVHLALSSLSSHSMKEVAFAASLNKRFAPIAFAVFIIIELSPLWLVSAGQYHDSLDRAAPDQECRARGAQGAQSLRLGRGAMGA